MKKIIFLLIINGMALVMKAQQTEPFIFATTIGTGLAINTPASTPFTWQIAGYYPINKRFSVGIGSGVSVYEKLLIPLFVNTKFAMTASRKFIPYVECGVGYSFAPDKHTNGGFYLCPSVGIQYSIYRNKRLLLALGYELQKFERLKTTTHTLFTAEFAEKLNHNSILLRLGFIF